MPLARMRSLSIFARHPRGGYRACFNHLRLKSPHWCLQRRGLRFIKRNLRCRLKKRHKTATRNCLPSEPPKLAWDRI